MEQVIQVFDYLTVCKLIQTLLHLLTLNLSNRLVDHKIRHKACKETTSFIPNGGVTVQGEGRKDYHTEWSFSPAIELPALHESIRTCTIFG